LQTHIIKIIICEVSGPHGCKHEDDRLLGCCAVWLSGNRPIALMIEAVSTSETSVNFYESTWCNIPEDIFISATAVESH
jgi:hypothetical protein